MTLFQLRQTALLLITALIWGATFVAQALGMDSVSPFVFTAGRMFLGVIFVLPIVWLLKKRLEKYHPAEAARRKTPEYRRALLLGSVLCGLCLFGGESLQQFGLFHDTEVGKAGFITALYIVIVPILGLFLGKRLNASIILSVIISVVGLWYLCVPEGGFSLKLGDALIALCALVFSLHILVISHFVLKVNGIELAVGQFAVGSLLGAISMLIKGYDVVDEVIGQGGKKLYTEYICHIDLRLMGKAGKYDDMEELQEKCESVMAELAKSEVLNVKSAKLGSAVQTLPLHRLERQAELSIGICSEEDISE